MSNAAALPPRRTFGVIRGGKELQRQLSIGPLTVCLCPHDELIRPSNCYFPPLELSVGVLGNAFPLEFHGLFTQVSRPGRTVGESVGGTFSINCFDWSNKIRYDVFDTRSDTEFKSKGISSQHVSIFGHIRTKLKNRRIIRFPPLLLI